jgi:hypothetical protein
MQLVVTQYRRYGVASTVVASSLVLLGASGGSRVLARVGDVALESYNEVASDWAYHTLYLLNPTYLHRS